MGNGHGFWEVVFFGLVFSTQHIFTLWLYFYPSRLHPEQNLPFSSLAFYVRMPRTYDPISWRFGGGWKGRLSLGGREGIQL